MSFLQLSEPMTAHAILGEIWLGAGPVAGRRAAVMDASLAQLWVERRCDLYEKNLGRRVACKRAQGER